MRLDLSPFPPLPLHISLLRLGLVRLCRVIPRGKFPKLLSVTAHSVTLCLEIIFSLKTNFVWKLWCPSFVMEAAAEPGWDQCAKQVNLRNRKRLSPVYMDENLPSKRSRRRKFSDCSSSSTSTVTQDSEPMTSPQEWKLNSYLSEQASNLILFQLHLSNYRSWLLLSD